MTMKTLLKKQRQIANLKSMQHIPQVIWMAWIALALSMSMLGCSQIESKQLLAAVEAEPEDFSLRNTRPEIFAFEIADQKGPFDIAFELTYFENQMQGWDALPLYFTLKSPDGKEQDHRFSLTLKDEKGDWKGELKENNADRIIEQVAKAGLDLAAGKYELKLFGDSKDLSKPILGIVRVTMKLYAK